MSSPTNTIHQAFQSLQRSISLEHRHTFESTELQDVWAAIQDIQTAQRKRHSAQNLRRIEPLLEALEKYAKVIEILCNGTQYLSFIWAPIKLLLQLASNHRDIFEALLDAYAEIGNALPRFDRYSSTFKDNPEFQSVLAGIYRAILEFHQRAYKFFQRRAWHLIFLSLWKDFGARFQGIINTIEKHRDFIDKEANSVDMVEDRAARIRILDDIVERQQQALAELDGNDFKMRLLQFQSSTSWVAVDDKRQEAELARRSKMRLAGTFDWIGQVPEMKAWLRDDDSEPILWLNGKPGAGKSVLCASIINLIGKAETLNVCYYFCNNQDDAWDNPSERILGTIAIQLLRAHPELASLITNEFVSRGLSSSLAQLKVLVPKLLELHPHTRIVIDGIDECSKAGQKTLLKELQSTCLGPRLHCKILISSRKEPNIKTELDKKPMISLDVNDKVESDIRRYVAHEIQNLQSAFIAELESDFFENIARLLTEKADGMFLWVKLIMKELEQCYNRRDLEECAQSLPHGLKEAYGRILDRMVAEDVPPHTQSLTIRILEWMSCSYQRLKIHEILDGVSIRTDRASLDRNTKLPRRVMDLCRPLIEDGPCNTLIFVHFSAQEYIMKVAFRHERPFIKPEEAHLNIGFSCIAYLNTSFRLLPQHSSEEERMLWVLQGLHGLQIYANQSWYKHIQAYMDLVIAQNLKIPEYFVEQMEEILKYNKAEVSGESTQSTTVGRSKSKQSPDRQYHSLKNFPGLNKFISSLEVFRDDLRTRDWTQKSIEAFSIEIRNSDPSWLSSTRHQYQLALEALLSPAFPSSSSVSEEELRAFRDIYGDSAFTCRYPHCDRSTDGFRSCQERAKHEAQHRREYRCDAPTCVYSEMGFATRPQLNRHTRKYHAQVDNGTSLPDEVRALKKRKLAEETARDQVQEQPKRQVTLFQPEKMRILPDTFPAKEKSKWQEGLRAIWERTDKNPRDSPQHNDAKTEVPEFSEALNPKLRVPERSSQQVETSAPLRPIPPLNNIQETLQYKHMKESGVPEKDPEFQWVQHQFVQKQKRAALFQQQQQIVNQQATTSTPNPAVGDGPIMLNKHDPAYPAYPLDVPSATSVRDERDAAAIQVTSHPLSPSLLSTQQNLVQDFKPMEDLRPTIPSTSTLYVDGTDAQLVPDAETRHEMSSPRRTLPSVHQEALSGNNPYSFEQAVSSGQFLQLETVRTDPPGLSYGVENTWMSATSKRNSDNPSTSTGQHAGDNMDMAVYRDIEPYKIFFDEMSVMAHEGGSDGSAEVENVYFDNAFFALDSNTAKSSVGEVEHVDFDKAFFALGSTKLPAEFQMVFDIKRRREELDEQKRLEDA